MTCICDIQLFPPFTYLPAGLSYVALSLPPASLLSPSVRGDVAFASFSGKPPPSSLAVLSSVADSCGVLEEAGPGAAYLYGPCALAARGADRKALQQNTLCVRFRAYTQITLVHLLFLSGGDVALLGGKLACPPMARPEVFSCMCLCVSVCVCVCLCVSVCVRDCAYILKPASEHVKNS